MIRKIFQLLLVFSLAFLVSACNDARPQEAAEKPALSFRAPDFALLDYEGNTVKLSNLYQEKPVMLNFWAGWCPFCLTEMPAMAATQDRFGEKIEVVAVNRGQSLEDAKNFTDSLNLTGEYTILLDPEDEIFNLYQGRAMPMTFFLSKGGVIRDIHYGSLDSSQMIEKIQKELGIEF